MNTVIREYEYFPRWYLQCQAACARTQAWLQKLATVSSTSLPPPYIPIPPRASLARAFRCASLLLCSRPDSLFRPPYLPLPRFLCVALGPWFTLPSPPRIVLFTFLSFFALIVSFSNRFPSPIAIPSRFSHGITVTSPLPSSLPSPYPLLLCVVCRRYGAPLPSCSRPTTN